MKKIRFLTVLLTLLTVLSAFTFSVNAAAADSGIEYRVSDDGTYVIVTGTTEEFPSIKIEATIGGLPVKEIAPSAFHNNYALYSIEIPDSVTVIGEAAFRNCRNLVSVRLPAGLKELPMDAFRDCFLLDGIVLPETLEVIDDFCFQGCRKLSKVTIPMSVKTIGHDVFMECESILLDVKNNPYAAEYAERNNVNTDFKATGTYFFLMVGGATVALLAVALLLSFLLKKHFKKHPTHNPALYIKKGFSAIKSLVTKLFKRKSK